MAEERIEPWVRTFEAEKGVRTGKTLQVGHLPGSVGTCGKCGKKVTLFDTGWSHTQNKSSDTHLRGVEVNVDSDPELTGSITPEKSKSFLRNVKAAATRRAAYKAKNVPEIPPETEPEAISTRPLGTFAHCSNTKCHKAIIVVQHPTDPTKLIWVHKSGPVHAAPIEDAKIPKTTIKLRPKTDEEREALKRTNIGPTTIDPSSGEVTIPRRKPKVKFDRSARELLELAPERPEEKLETDPDYVTAEGKIASTGFTDAEGNITKFPNDSTIGDRLNAQTVASLTKAKRGGMVQSLILGGIKHLEEDHPWEDIIKPEKVDTRQSDWKGQGGRGVDSLFAKRIPELTDIAHFLRQKLDPSHEYEYEVHTTNQLNNRTIGLRRRLKYCTKCSPTVLEDGSIPNARSGNRRQIQNPNQTVHRPDVKELPQGTKPEVRVGKYGLMTTRTRADSRGGKAISGLKRLMGSLEQGSNEGKE